MVVQIDVSIALTPEGFDTYTSSRDVELHNRDNWQNLLNESFPGRYTILGDPTADFSSNSVIYSVEDNSLSALSINPLSLADNIQGSGSFMVTTYRIALGKTRIDAESGALSFQGQIVPAVAYVVIAIIAAITVIAITWRITSSSITVADSSRDLQEACTSGRLTPEQCAQWQAYWLKFLEANPPLSKSLRDITIAVAIGAGLIGLVILGREYFMTQRSLAPTRSISTPVKIKKKKNKK